eukprot:1613065-Amphidinium_carterae.1
MLTRCTLGSWRVCTGGGGDFKVGSGRERSSGWPPKDYPCSQPESGHVVSHPLRMRKALGSNPSVSILNY